MRFAFQDSFLPEFAHYERLGRLRRDPALRTPVPITADAELRDDISVRDRIFPNRWFRNIWSKCAREIADRRDIARLRRLPDYALRDLGLTPGDIENAVRFGRTGEP